jgi:long-chain acyl-CoA synthetase
MQIGGKRLSRVSTAIGAVMRVQLKIARTLPINNPTTISMVFAPRATNVAPITNSVAASNRRFVVDASVKDPWVQPWTRLFAETNGDPIRVAPDVDAPAVLLTTSGTTGQSKFVVHTLATLSKTAESIEHWDLDSDQISSLFCPMVHASGLFTMLACIRFGVPFVLHERFNPDAILDAIERYHCTWVVGLPFMFATLVRHQRACGRNVDSLRTCLVGGDVCPPQLQDQFSAVFGIPLRSLWAATEACGSLTYGMQQGPVSRIAPGAQVRLVDDHHVLVPRGEVGELLVRGPHVTIGYWAGPGRIKDPPKEGWFHTGDLMRQDEKGDLWFVSRKKHLIIRGGSNISPVEVERGRTVLIQGAGGAVGSVAVVARAQARCHRRRNRICRKHRPCEGYGADLVIDYAATPFRIPAVRSDTSVAEQPVEACRRQDRLLGRRRGKMRSGDERTTKGTLT